MTTTEIVKRLITETDKSTREILSEFHIPHPGEIDYHSLGAIAKLAGAALAHKDVYTRLKTSAGLTQIFRPATKKTKRVMWRGKAGHQIKHAFAQQDRAIVRIIKGKKPYKPKHPVTNPHSMYSPEARAREGMAAKIPKIARKEPGRLAKLAARYWPQTIN